MNEFDKYEFERWIRDDLDGRLYFDDLIERVIEHRVHSKAWEQYENIGDEVSAESYDAGYDNGFSEGYEEGRQEAFNAGYKDGYARAKRDANPTQPM